MTRQIFASALFAGLAAGLIAALLQFAFVTPVLLEGELYETGALTHFAGAPGTDHSATDHAHEATETAGHDHAAETPGGSRRVAQMFFMNLVTYTGFALVLVAAFALAERAGHAINLRNGVIWGIAAFAAVHLAPALGLPPELPGTPAADITLRQYWWVGTVIATMIGLALLVFGRGIAPALAGLVVLALPHIWGAPVLDYHGGIAPPELSGLFVARSLGVGAIAFAVLGGVAGYFWNRTA